MDPFSLFVTGFDAAAVSVDALLGVFDRYGRCSVTVWRSYKRKACAKVTFGRPHHARQAMDALSTGPVPELGARRLMIKTFQDHGLFQPGPAGVGAGARGPPPPPHALYPAAAAPGRMPTPHEMYLAQVMHMMAAASVGNALAPRHPGAGEAPPQLGPT